MATTAENIANSLKMYSVWVAGLISLAAGYWIQLPVEQQQQILAQWPQLKYYSPIFAFAAFYAARVISQQKPDPAPAPVEPVAPAPIGTASLMATPVVAADAPPAAVPLQLTATEVAAILTAAEVLKKQAPQ